MNLKHLVLVLGAAPAILASAGCAEGGSIDDIPGGSSAGGSVSNTGGAGGGPSTGGNGNASQSGGTGGIGPCGDRCDQDGDGVVDAMDTCPGTPTGEPVNDAGCSESQLEPELERTWPPYGLTWTQTGDLGRAGGMTWSYTDIDPADLFHIYWVLCDDPETPCGVSLDGPIDTGEGWVFNAAQSDLPGGELVFHNSTHVLLADGSTPVLTGRLTVTIAGVNDGVVPFADLMTLGVMGADGEYGAEIPDTSFTIVALVEVQDATAVWAPYLDYFDAALTPDPSPGAAVSFGGSFYDE